MDKPSVGREILGLILQRQLPGGGFSGAPQALARPDATAWALIALEQAGGSESAHRSGLAYLTALQEPDGSLPLDKDFPETFWPTSLALLAFCAAKQNAQAQAAAQFLLKTSGFHWPKSGNIFGHDTALRGWPWTRGCHSWVEPTALAMLGLSACGFGDSPRLAEAVAMLLDRQLPSGGWNYGNTTVFGAELKPLPEATGHALVALAGRCEPGAIVKSLDYLENLSPAPRTPLTLAWSVFGLAAWGRPPREAWRKVSELLTSPNPQGYFETSLLAQLYLASQVEDSLPRAFAAKA